MSPKGSGGSREKRPVQLSADAKRRTLMRDYNVLIAENFPEEQLDGLRDALENVGVPAGTPLALVFRGENYPNEVATRVSPECQALYSPKDYTIVSAHWADSQVNYYRDNNGSVRAAYARLLAHEIGHAYYYKMLDADDHSFIEQRFNHAFSQTIGRGTSQRPYRLKNEREYWAEWFADAAFPYGGFGYGKSFPVPPAWGDGEMDTRFIRRMGFTRKNGFDTSWIDEQTDWLNK